MEQKHTLFESEVKMEIRKALKKGLLHSQTWINGSVIVMDQDHDFDAVPGAYLDDISYSGSREVIYEIGQLDDYGDQVDINSEEDLDFIIDMILPTLEL